MRKSDLPAGKRRYALSLTPEHVNRFHSVLISIGANKAYMSKCVDDFIRDTADSLETLIQMNKEKGKNIGFKDVFWVLGSKLDELVKDESEYKEKEKICPECGKPLHKFHNCLLNPTAEGRKNEKQTPKAKRVEKKNG